MAKLPLVGLQAIVLGKKYSVESDDVLDVVARAGYAALECGAKDPAAFRRKLDARGLKYAGAHATPKGFGDVKGMIERLKVLGGSDVSNSGFIDWNKRTAADAKQTIDALNAAGRELRQSGIHLHYHNHDFEFLEKIDGKMIIDVLLDGFDPDAVDLCVDVAWVTKGGLDPVEFLLKHNKQVGYLHLKDYDDQGWTELGRGTVDLKGVIGILPRLTGVRWVVCEQDSSRIDPLESIAISRKYLRDAFNY